MALHQDLKISTTRLDLRPISADDASEMFAVLNDSSLYTFTGGEPPASIQELRDVYAWRESLQGHSPDGTERWINWLLRERAQQNVIGYVQATVFSTYADIAWVVGSQWQRRGYASEAAIAVVAWLGANAIRDIRANIHPQHLASQAVARNAGFSPTGAVRADGEQVWATP